jgi:hypothetical protein
MEDPKLSQSYLLADEVNVNLDMLRVPMMNWIRCHVDGTHVVTEDNRSRGEGNVEFLQKLADPRTLGDSMSNSSILGLSANLDTVVWHLEDQEIRLSPRKTQKLEVKSLDTRPNPHMNMRSMNGWDLWRCGGRRRACPISSGECA